MTATKEELLSRIGSLDFHELRTLNRYHLHLEDKRCCSSCRIIYDGIKDNFHIKKYTLSGISYNVKCSKCLNKMGRERTAEYRKDPHQFIRNRFNSYTSRARIQKIPCNLTKEYLIEQWDKQKGLCFYTNEVIDFTFTTEKGDHPHLCTPSLDKLNPELGYVMGNVVWCSYGINRMKNDLDYSTFLLACKTVLQTRGES